MHLPTSSSDIRLQVPCIICSGNGSFGSRNNHPSDCENCDRTGWQEGDFYKLSAAQLTKLRALLPALPLDPATPYPDEDPMINLAKLLTNRQIETVAFPKLDATEIDLIDHRGNVLRLHTNPNRGKPTLNVIPIPPKNTETLKS